MAETLFLSLELMYLMNWLMKHERARLRLLIKQALNNGLDTQLESIERFKRNADPKVEEQFHETFLEFIQFLEQSMFEAQEKNNEQNPLQHDLLTALQQLNVKDIDAQTVWPSVKKARSTLKKQSEAEQKNSPQEVKNVLLATLLDNWTPSHDDSVN